MRYYGDYRTKENISNCIVQVSKNVVYDKIDRQCESKKVNKSIPYCAMHNRMIKNGRKLLIPKDE